MARGPPSLLKKLLYSSTGFLDYTGLSGAKGPIIDLIKISPVEMVQQSTHCTPGCNNFNNPICLQLP